MCAGRSTLSVFPLSRDPRRGGSRVLRVNAHDRPLAPGAERRVTPRDPTIYSSKRGDRGDPDAQRARLERSVHGARAPVRSVGWPPAAGRPRVPTSSGSRGGRLRHATLRPDEPRVQSAMAGAPADHVPRVCTASFSWEPAAPCPAGFPGPTSKEWDALVGGGTAGGSTSTSPEGGAPEGARCRFEVYLAAKGSLFERDTGRLTPGKNSDPLAHPRGGRRGAD